MNTKITKTTPFTKASLAAMSFMALGLLSCEKEDEKDHHHEEEVITAVQIAVIPEVGSDTTFVKWSDIDGDGGNAPVIDTLILNKTSNYTFNLQFLHETETESEDLTEEIKEEANDHLVCSFSNTGLQNSTIDTDSNGLPLGLIQLVSADSATSGEITFQLKHQPEVKNGQCDVGATDIEVSFPVVIS